MMKLLLNIITVELDILSIMPSILPYLPSQTEANIED